MALPDNPIERKQVPLCTGVLDYFPDALAEVARCSMAGNRQHHPDRPLHWDKSKSKDEADALMRHLVQRGTTDTDGIRHSAKVAWRALALLQREMDEENNRAGRGDEYGEQREPVRPEEHSSYGGSMRDIWIRNYRAMLPD